MSMKHRIPFRINNHTENYFINNFYVVLTLLLLLLLLRCMRYVYTNFLADLHFSK